MDAVPSEGLVPEKMRVWRYYKFGGGADALKLEEVPVPRPGKGEVLVRVQVSSVNPADWKMQDGYLRPFLPWSLPFIPGLDLAGEVAALGVGVDNFKPGDQVFGTPNLWKVGGLAEYSLLPTSTCMLRPEGVPAVHAAALLAAGGTALQVLREYAGVKVSMGAAADPTPTPGPPTKNVLIANATGGVGHYAVQLAKLGGAHVTATCGARNMEFVRSLGADEVLDYKSPDGQELKSPSGVAYDAVLDGTTSLTWPVVSKVLAPRGKWIHLTPTFPVLLTSLYGALTFSAKRAVPVLGVFPNVADFNTLGQLAAEGRLRTTIDAEFPFSKAPDAWRKSAGGHVVGKVVVVRDGDEASS